MKIRVKFRKFGSMKFIGHLDMMRYFQKAVRRAEIDICYSEGFSPHMIMSFAAPLGVGITSDGEYFDIDVKDTEKRTSAEAIEAFNKTMVSGVEVTGYVKLPDNAKTAMSLIAAADYTLTFKEGYDKLYSKSEWASLIQKEFHDKKEFMVIKKTKKNETEIDLKPYVYTFEVLGTEDAPEFHIFVSAGSIKNIKPEFVLESVYNRLGLEYNSNAIQIHRNEVYAYKDDSETEFISLLDMGEEIC